MTLDQSKVIHRVVGTNYGSREIRKHHSLKALRLTFEEVDGVVQEVAHEHPVDHGGAEDGDQREEAHHALVVLPQDLAHELRELGLLVT